jgi:Flp pilus assembly protein TadD
LNPPPQFCTSGRPLPNLSLAVNYHFGGLDPIGYHVFNIIVHLLSALLLWAIVGRVLQLEYFQGKFQPAAWQLSVLVALLWALHPLQTEAVVYITQRTELMVGFFYLATLYASLHYWTATATRARAVWLVFAALACWSGMACKEVMVSAPILLLLFERTFIAGSFRRALRMSWSLYVGLTLGWFLLLALNFSGPRSDTAGFHLGVPAYSWWLTQTRVLIIYLKLCILPWPLVIHYHIPYLQTFVSAWPWLLPVALLALITLVLVWRRTATGFVLATVLVILAPTLIVPITTEVAAERRMYLPLAALVALFVGTGYTLARWAVSFVSFEGRYVPAVRATALCTIVPTLIVALLLAATSARRVAAYDDPLVLWQDTLTHAPGSSIVRINLAMTLASRGRLEEAIPQFEAAANLEPESADSQNNLGCAFMGAGRWQEAVSCLKEAVELKPGFAEAHNNLAVALANTGRQADGLSHLEQAVRLKPEYVAARENLGMALAKAGRPLEAVEQLELVLRQHPDSVESLTALANAYFELGRNDEAVDMAERGMSVARSHGHIEQVSRIEAWLEERRAAAAPP